MQQPPPGPPVAPAQPVVHERHGTRRVDNYAWLKATRSEAVLAHLAAERAWYDAATSHLHSLVETLTAEMSSRVPPADRSVSWRRVQFSYYTWAPIGREHAQLLRFRHERGGTGATKSVVRDPDGHRIDTGQLLLDANRLATDSGYLELGLCLISPDERRLAYSVDTDGDEVYRLHVRDLDTGDDLPEVVERTYYGGAWSADSGTFFYTVHDEAYRPHQVWRHRLGTSVDDDELVFAESDERFTLDVRATRSGDLVVIASLSRDTSEMWLVDAHDPSSAPHCVQPRRTGVEYHVEHARTPTGGALLVLTDEGVTEFRLLSAPVQGADVAERAQWRELVAHDLAERLSGIDAFADYLVLSVRRDGFPVLRVLDLDGTPLRDLECALPAGQIRLARNDLFDVDTVTVVEESYVQPPVWSDIDVRSGARTERHRQEVPGYEAAGYVTERLAVPSDGVEVPATLVRHRDTPLDGTAPALLWGYGAYEACDDPAFDTALPSLLDRGVVFAQSHPRGGGERGRRWWLDGRMQHKQHTFDDHLAVAEHLVSEGLVDGARLATRGLSAGGLLQGVVFSQRPKRWRAVVAEVPFVDVVNTMLDPSIPLTVNEWDEWGDPRRADDFAWMLAYSPYDNLPPAGDRPDLLVTGAVHDPRVMVWEPAKWVAALRASDPEWSPRCLFRVETGAGAHTGPSGRYAHLRYEAEVAAWVLDRLVEAGPPV